MYFIQAYDTWCKIMYIKRRSKKNKEDFIDSLMAVINIIEGNIISQYSNEEMRLLKILYLMEKDQYFVGDITSPLCDIDLDRKEKAKKIIIKQLENLREHKYNLFIFDFSKYNRLFPNDQGPIINGYITYQYIVEIRNVLRHLK